jgi:uncharacterized membrane protein YebE (DUF533 family)
MFIIFGTMGIKNRVSDEAPLTGQCPNCTGNLHLKRYKRWFTLFFIPIFPFETIDTFYECDKCNNAYAERIREVLTQSNEQKEKALTEAKKLFAKTLVATMTHMAMIDGHFADEEEREIKEVMNKFPDYINEIEPLFQKVKINGNADNFVFNLLNEARNVLSAEAVLNLIAQSAVVLLADGKIENEEKQLMEEYLISCGLPKSFYSTLLEKLKKVPVADKAAIAN